MDQPLHGRGTGRNPDNRYAAHGREAVDDGWLREADGKPRTVISLHEAKSIISRNNSPDVRFQQSINPYQGCEHVRWNTTCRLVGT